jgi:hypothetical protein
MRVASEEDIGSEGVIAVRSFDEDLSLMGRKDEVIEVTEGVEAILVIDGEITVEGEGLAVET